MNLFDLTSMVALEAPSIPNPILQRHLLLAARDLCTFSLAWQSDIILSLTGADKYTLAYEGAELVEPVSAAFSPNDGADTTKLNPTTPAQMDNHDSSWRIRLGNPLWYMFPDRDTEVKFVPNPSQGTAYLRVALQPALFSSEPQIDDRVGKTYFEGLVHGALSKVLRIPDVKWTDLKRAEYYRALFDEAKNNAQVRGVDRFAKVIRKVRYGGL